MLLYKKTSRSCVYDMLNENLDGSSCHCNWLISLCLFYVIHLPAPGKALSSHSLTQTES